MSHMHPDQLLEICRQIAPSDVDITTELAREGHGAVIRMRCAAHPERLATVRAFSTGWMELVIDGGFGTFEADELAARDDLVEYLTAFVELGVKYLREGADEGFSPILRAPIRTVDAARDRHGVLTLSANEAWQHWWRRVSRR